MENLQARCEIRQCLPPLAVTGNTARTYTVDLQNRLSLMFGLHFGAFLAAASVDVQFDESDDNSSFSSVAATDLLGPLNGVDYTTTSANTSYQFSYIGIKRYVKITLTHTVNSSTGVLSAVDAILIKRSQTTD